MHSEFVVGQIVEPVLGHVSVDTTDDRTMDDWAGLPVIGNEYQ